MFSLLIFDLDGTLVDSRKDLAFSVNATLADIGCPTLPDETIYGYVGNGVSRLLSDAVNQRAYASVEGEALRALPAEGGRPLRGVRPLRGAKQAPVITTASPDLMERAHKIFEAHYLAHLTDCTRLYTGMEAVLEHYRDKQKVVVTNKRSQFTRKIMENLCVTHRFERLICSDEIGALKPDPAMFIHALKQLNRSAVETLVIGDMENDICAAHACGISVCAVGYGFGEAKSLKKAHPEFFAETVGDLIQFHF